jgi:phage terminase large subunit-like protein
VAALTPAARAAAIELARRRQRRHHALTETRDAAAWLQAQLPEVFPLPFGPQHRHLASLLDSHGPAGLRAVVGAQRGAGKSTMGLLGLPLVALVRRSHRFVVLLRATDTDARAALEALRDTLRAKPALVARYPWLAEHSYSHGELRLAGALVVSRGAGSAIRGLSREVGGRMLRPDLVVGDDLETDESARSRLQTSRLEDWLVKTVAQLGGPPGDPDASPLDLLVIGTTLTPSALVARALDGSGPLASWHTARYPAEVLADGAGGATTRSGRVVPVPTGDAPAGTRVATWEAGQPLAYLDRLTDPTDRLFIGSLGYAQEYLLEPRSTSSTLLSAEHLQLRALPTSRRTYQKLAIAVDPAASTKTAADYSAVAVVGLHQPADDGRPVLGVPYVARRRVTLAELLTWVDEVRTLYPTATVVFEANGGFAWGAQELRRRRVPVRAVTAQADKRTRALPLSIWWEAHRVWLDPELEGTPAVDELTSFTGAGDVHDDQVDAVVHGAAFVTGGWRTA